MNCFLLIFSHCGTYLRSIHARDLTESQTCIIPVDCKLSDWSPWTPYNSSCIERDGQRRQGYMVQTRSIIQLPLGTGQPCQHLTLYFPIKGEEERPCVRYLSLLLT